jgi:F-type H+-transporting ATPase subunit c
MLKRVSIGLILLAVAVMPTVAMAAESPATQPGERQVAVSVSAEKGGFMLFDAKGAAYFAAAIGAGLVILGGAKGIGHIGGSAVESMARQPEAAGSINGAMIITAAMIEGATLFAVVLCLLLTFK